MEPTGIEPVSALDIDLALVHRFIPSNPRGRNHLLSRMVGCSGEVLTNTPTRGGVSAHPLGFTHSP